MNERYRAWYLLSADRPWGALQTFGCFGTAPTADHRFKRFLAVVSFEDGSDVSDYVIEADTLAEAEQVYRAVEIHDLDTGKKYDVEWIQKAVEA